MLATIQSWLIVLFGGDEPRLPLEVYQVAARAVAVYLIGLAIVRVGKSRLIGRFSTIDVIVGFILGSVLGRGITGGASLSNTTVASAALVAAHWAVTWVACRSHAFGNLIKGHCYVLIQNGTIDEHAMRRSHISHADLEEAMRLRGVDRLDQVRRAYKERSGEISVLRREKE